MARGDIVCKDMFIRCRPDMHSMPAGGIRSSATVTSWYKGAQNTICMGLVHSEDELHAAFDRSFFQAGCYNAHG